MQLPTPNFVLLTKEPQANKPQTINLKTMDNATLHQLQSALRRLVPDSIGDTFTEIKKHLPEFSAKYSALILLESRLNDANLQRIEGTINEDDLQLRYNQIRADLLLFINALEVNDFSLPVAGAPASKTGSLLYKIPTHMTLQKETKCVVRLAFEKESIIRNIELDSDVEIKSVRVAEVMQVELIDPTEPHPFAIRTISDEEQFIEKGDYSEWCFYVKPILEGTFPLVLKISVIEIVLGKERLRNLTYEENIQITATISGAKEPDFKLMGITVGTTTLPNAPVLPAAAPPQPKEMDIFEVEIIKPDIAISPAPVVDIPRQAAQEEPPGAPPVMPSPPIPAKKNRSSISWMAAAASVLLIVTVAIFIIPRNSSVNENNPINVVPNIKQDSFLVLPKDSLIVAPEDSVWEKDRILNR